MEGLGACGLPAAHVRATDLGRGKRTQPAMRQANLPLSGASARNCRRLRCGLEGSKEDTSHDQEREAQAGRNENDDQGHSRKAPTNDLFA